MYRIRKLTLHSLAHSQSTDWLLTLAGHVLGNEKKLMNKTVRMAAIFQSVM